MDIPETEQAPFGKQILLVEDHRDSAEAITMILEMEGYVVRWVATAREALQALSASAAAGSQASLPDLILLDLMLPDMSGIELVREWSATGQAIPPIIIASAKPPQAIKSAACSIGAAGIVRKPFSLDELLGCVAAVLSRKDMRQLGPEV